MYCDCSCMQNLHLKQFHHKISHLPVLWEQVRACRKWSRDQAQIHTSVDPSSPSLKSENMIESPWSRLEQSSLSFLLIDFAPKDLGRLLKINPVGPAKLTIMTIATFNHHRLWPRRVKKQGCYLILRGCLVWSPVVYEVAKTLGDTERRIKMVFSFFVVGGGV